MKTSVASLIFNRPDTTERVFDGTRQVKPPRLLVVADDPRPDRPGEAEKFNKIKKTGQMKVLHISNYDNSGAGRAAYRLHKGLQLLGIDSQMLVQYKSNGDRAVLEQQNYLEKLVAKLKIAERVDALPLEVYRERNYSNFSLQWFPEAIAPKVARLHPDVINLHWICQAFLKIETLSKFDKPIIWTLHDMWAFTGGCHYSQNCNRYRDSCGACPQLQSNRDWDLSRWVWQRKAKAWKNLNLTIVTPSIWLAKCASSSSLFKDVRVEVIPNGIDTRKYRPINRQIARSLLNLPQDKKLLLFGAIYASERRKGLHLLQPALQNLSKAGLQEQVELVVFGASESKDKTEIGFKSHYLGRFSDDISLALVYAAADVFVAPSIEDNLPNTVMEALACGTPCLAFNIGGMPDMIEHQQNGYLAQPLESEDLSRGIAWVIENPERHQKLCVRARQKAEQEFTQELQAHRYNSLFSELVSPSTSPA